MYERLPPEERAFLIERIAEQKQNLTRAQTPAREAVNEVPARLSEPTLREIAAPRESEAYRAYPASMGEIERRLLNAAVRQREQAATPVSGRDEQSLSITEARALLPRETQRRIRQQARAQAWEELAPPPEFLTRAPEAARLSAVITELMSTKNEKLTKVVIEKLTTSDTRQGDSAGQRTNDQFFFI